MSLRVKMVLIIGIAVLGGVTILYILSQEVLLKSYLQFEKTSTERNTNRVLSSYIDDVNNLVMFDRDWSQWDDTYNFVIDRNTDYVKSNLLDQTYIGLKLNLILILNNNRDIVYGGAYDLNKNTAVPIPQDISQFISKSSPLMNIHDVNNEVSGLVELPQNPMIVVSRMITTSDGSGLGRGYFILGRYLDSSEVSQLENVTHLTIKTVNYNDPDLTADFQKARSSISAGSPIFTRPLNEQTVSGYGILKDISGQPAVIFRIDISRDYYNQGRQIINYLMIFAAAISVFFGLSAIVLIETQFLRRLSRLSRSVITISRTQDTSSRVEVKGDDELSHYAANFNRMLDTIQGLYQSEKDLRSKLETEMKQRIEFTRALVHELKTPLTPMISSSELLIEEAKEEPGQSLAKNVNAGANNLNRRIDELLDLARSETGMLKIDSQPVDFEKVLKESAAYFKPAAGAAGLSITEDIPKLPIIFADEDRLKQVIFNLLDNAIKYTAPGGRITVKASASDEEVSVEVTNSGEPISKEKMNHLFKPYQRLAAEHNIGGLGIGLALSKTIVELHGGKIWVKSDGMNGNTFSFSIPIKRTQTLQKEIKA